MAIWLDVYKIKVNIRYIGTYIACRKDPAAPIYTERTLLAVLKPTGSLQYSDPSDRLQQATSHCLRVLAFTAALILDLIIIRSSIYDGSEEVKNT